MRQLSAMLLLLAAFCLASATARAEQRGHNTVELCTIDAPPITTVAHDGMLDAILREAFRRAGQSLRMIIAPSERGLVNANSGAVCGVANRIAGLEKGYPNLLRVPEPNMTYEFMAFARKPLAVRDWEGLKGLRVGYITGWKILEENVRAASVIKADGPGQLFELLATDRVDVVLYERQLGQHQTSVMGLSDVRALEPPLARRDMFVYLNARHAALVPRLAAALRAMKADGTYAAILARRKARLTP